jgi:predicted aldo/keto reductase-like oxidoreductase
MRLPVVDHDMARIDEEGAARLIRTAVERGVNYLDTAYPYHGGESEPFVGRLLASGLRSRVLVATKLPTWLVETEADWERLLDRQLARLACDRIDFYLFHGLSEERWERVRRLNGLQALERARSDGRIRFIGFSFHGSPAAFTSIVDAYDWDVCQIQYNFMDEKYQAGTAGLLRAASRGVGVIAMEPLRGGVLAADGPQEVQAIRARSANRQSPAQLALGWVWNHPEVTTALSGMNRAPQVEENLAAADAARAGAMSGEDLALVAEVRDCYRTRMKVDCTTCGYCQPCPNGVSIPDVLSLHNSGVMFDSQRNAAMVYRHWVAANGHGVEACLKCGECEPKCPQQIPIMEKLDEAHRYLTAP